MTIEEIKKILKNNPGDNFISELLEDQRKGVQSLLKSYFNKQELYTKEKIRLEKLNEFENKLFDQGYEYIAGVDEAERGPLAGPLVVAAVILPKDTLLYGINDSKKLSQKKREELYIQIKEKALSFKIEVIDIDVIDSLNIYKATIYGMKKALLSLDIKPDYALVDAMDLKELPFHTKSLVHGDSLSTSIAAASILAKVTRDDIMSKLESQYPGYGFLNNKGYGTKEHIDAIYQKGITKEHRKTYEPIKSIIEKPF